MITIVDYGLGNVQAFCNVYERLKIKAKTARNAIGLRNSEKLILPGVGAFDYAMTRLNASGMRDELEKQVLINKVPVIGVCVGMQILARRSDEGVLPGLGWIDAEVRKLGVRDQESGGRREEISLPHMGWNDAVPVRKSPLFEGVQAPRFYFLHSYYFSPRHPSQILATTSYHGVFASAVRDGNIFGVQFHPEKSHQWGVRLLENFARI